MSSPISPARIPSASSPPKPRIRTISGWLKSLSPSPSGGEVSRKLTKNKPLPAPPVAPERPGTPLKEETFREVITVTPSPRREGYETRRAEAELVQYNNGYGYDRAYTKGYGEDEKREAWRTDAPPDWQKHARSASSDRPALSSAYASAPSPARAALPSAERAGRVLSAPPPARDAYTTPPRPWPSLATGGTPPSGGLRVPVVVAKPPTGSNSQTMRYALAESPTRPYMPDGRVQMPTPMMPIDAFAALSLGGPTHSPSCSAPPDTLDPRAGLGQSSSAVSLQAPPQTPTRIAPDPRNSPHTPANQARRRTRSSSSPASPSFNAPTSPATPAGAGSPATQQPKMTVQCAGITKAGLPCQRQVKAISALAFLAPDEAIERFCHQHGGEVLEPSGFYTRPRGQQGAQWVTFAQWIPPYLSQPTRVLLRTTMEAPPSVSDLPGHIYAYELRGPPSEPVALKVGRATNVKNRLGEWGRQCAKEVVLRGLWPPPEGTRERDASLLRGRLKPGDKARCSHRLERLIHLELADISVYSTHLTPEFLAPFPVAPASPANASPVRGRKGHLNGAVPASPASPAGKKKPVRRPLTPCEECGKLHREIFTFERASRGKVKGKEWEEVVWPVMERWGRFVEMVYEDDVE